MSAPTLENLLPFHFAGIRFARLQKILAVFGDLKTALEADRARWERLKLLTAHQLDRLLDPAQSAWQAEARAWQSESGQHLLHYWAEGYPPLLKETADPPWLLYVRGSVDLLSDPQVAMVGARRATQSGQASAASLAQALTEKGLTVTSGLASGIDRAAHEGALKAGQTVAVVATGLDRVYPASNHRLAQAVAAQGALVSEYPLGTRPLARHFPARNRIIAGLSHGTLVVEAALKSGSLITAKQALEQGREVFAMPGSIHDPQVKGCHQLIREGAKLVETAEHVLEELGPGLHSAVAPPVQTSVRADPPESETDLFRWLTYEPCSLDELAQVSGLSVATLQSELLMLELEGRVEALSAGRFRRMGN
ncbi:DNA-processing protein DprA [Thiomicrospira sp. WB1]|uniref:DNA-processing protein DprA n=1 Tax=Thiomicrospira sp. WB1 TaxID=1685380 RepID=UPI00074930C6|nr:DNA-processing protein DprA [Thiomicrospira sp. WB1]KUJ71197.1 DNA processing protein DprA [Thiomicrospira sp. WB1]